MYSKCRKTINLVRPWPFFWIRLIATFFADHHNKAIGNAVDTSSNPAVINIHNRFSFSQKTSVLDGNVPKIVQLWLSCRWLRSVYIHLRYVCMYYSIRYTYMNFPTCSPNVQLKPNNSYLWWIYKSMSNFIGIWIKTKIVSINCKMGFIFIANTLRP